MAIKSENGKYKSERTASELAQLVQMDLSRLSVEEREALDILLKELDEPEQQGKKLLSILSQAELKEEPVDMETFVRDPYYMGNTCDMLYPRWLADLTELFEGGYQEAVFTGSIGCGKTFAASVGICRILYELSLMVDPHRSFGLAAGSNIAIVVLSVNEMLAQKVAFENIVSKIQASPYFQEKFPFEQTKKELRFPNNVWVAPRATTDTSALGLNVMSGMIDESNFMPVKKGKGADKFNISHDRADMLYNVLKRRMKSRFERQGKLPGVLFVVSSKNTRDNFTERLLARAKDDPSVFVRDYATWEVKPDEYFNTRRFWVLVGNEQTPSRILTENEEAQYKDNLPDGCVLVDVPEDYRKDFERDLEGSIRDMAGIATVSVSPFIQRREKIVDAIASYRAVYGNRGHPFTALEFEPGKPGEFKWSQMVHTVTEKQGFLAPAERRQRPLINPTAARAIHIDPSLANDATGFCMAHVSGWKDVIRRAGDGSEYVERAPIYTVDFALRVVPPIGDEILLSDLRQFVYDLTAHGYIVTKVTLDQYQSADTIQQLSAKGYDAERLSVDVSLDPYENLKQALYEDRLLMYEYEPLLEELRTVQKDIQRRKVDHPPGGSKDVADALAGCLYTLSQSNIHEPLPIVKTNTNPAESFLPPIESKEGGKLTTGASSGYVHDILPPFLIGNSGGGSGDGWDD